MANLPETPDYPAGIYQLETSDPVLGGAGGIANRQGEQLANRTAWLKAKVDAFIDGTVAVLKATKLATARTLSISGAASGSASFDGSANAAIALTLADSGAVAGTYPKVTINAKGLVTGGAALVAADIPSLDWSKINSGKPTTLGGYGITDAAPIASPTFTGVPAGPTAAAGTNTTQLATTAFVAAVKAALDAADALKAPLASPALTGTPTAPTAAAGTNTTQLATTAFVNAEIANDAYLKADFADRLVSRGGNANGTYNIWSSGKTECFGTALITAPSTLVTLPVALPSTAGVSVMHSAQSTNPNVSVTTVLESTTQVRVYTTSTVTVSIEVRGGI